MKFINPLLPALGMLLLFSCKKDPQNDPIPVPPPPTSVDTNSYVAFTVIGFSHTNEPAFVLLSIENNAGELIETNKKIRLTHKNSVYSTDSIKVNKGAYKLVKFIVTTGSDSAVFATPLANSPKANAVQAPLSLPFSISLKGRANVNVEVAPIHGSDEPENFGYAETDFGFTAYTNIRVKLKIKVGNIIYDSLPGTLEIESRDGSTPQWTRTIDLQQGVNTIRLPKKHKAYHFQVKKWNTVSNRSINLGNDSENMLVQMEAIRNAKNLQERRIYSDSLGAFVINSKDEYTYNADGSLKRIRYYEKIPQFMDIQHRYTYDFIYSSAGLEKINRYDHENKLTGYTSFIYSGNKIANINARNYDQQTFSNVEYSVTGQAEVVTINYLYDNGNAMVYKMTFSGGNKVYDEAISSRGGSQSGTYQYDHNVNPFVHLNYPDLYLSNRSKNNPTSEQVGYSGGFPTVVPYKFEYSYDTDGFPSELVKSFKGYSSNQHSFRLKIVFIY